jgi:hypothetical protein
MHFKKTNGIRNYFLVFSGFVIILFSAYAKAETINARVLFSVPYYATNSPNESFTPVVHSKGRTFLVWVDTNNRPWVTMHYNNIVTVQPLDSSPDYTAFPDGHHRFSMGIDKNGYLHITGDMHYYPSGPDGNTYLPTRYQNQTVMYWISNQPLTVAGGFSFAGGLHASTAIPGTGFLLGRFIHDKNGELYYSSMVRAYDNGNFLNGMGGLGLYHYNVDSRTWTALGGYADATNAPGTKYYKVLFWENSGYAPDGWFQDYQSTFKFDNQNRLHVAISANVSSALALNNRLLYANSSDGGLTWKRANGSSIPGLPLRGVDSSPNVADVVTDTKGVVGLPVYADVVADQSGNPAVFSDIWRRWDGKQWAADIGSSSKVWGSRGMLGPDGKMTFNEVDTIYLRRTNAFTQNSSAYQVQTLLPASHLHFFQCISELGLQSSGSLYGVGTDDSATSQLQVAKIDFISNPLPAPWSATDIGNNLVYGGATDFTGTTINLRASGAGISGTADNLHFAYRSLTGDGSIVARVVSQDSLRAWSNTGVMMRETLNANASVAMTGITVSSGTQAIYRNGTNANAAATQISPSPAPQWVKLMRSGNVFTSYYSTDGGTWTQIGTPRTILMAQTIYVGLTTWAFADLVHTATMDNVKVSP